MQQKEYNKAHYKSKTLESEENRSPNGFSTGQSNTTILDQPRSPIDDTNLSSTSPICSAPVCRQFWKSGNYDEGLVSKSIIKDGSSYLHIHPRFLHSNATSHKWAFGAIAELLDNAVDEIQNGATFVIVDKTSNPRDGCPALLIQDDGGGMDPEAMRRCLSFGFSDKKSKSAIGQYGNGFKTSSMRLGADVIVFSRHSKEGSERKLTQSIGLLSYTFLTQTGHDRIVVPMVDYEFNTFTSRFETLHPYGKEHFMSNLSMLFQWSPFSTESELLKQFDDIGYHGTKVIIYNLWLNDEDTMELDFNSDPEDICLRQDAKPMEKGRGMNRNGLVNEQHMANRLHYSLRVYLSILYLRLPESFSIILRGRVIDYHNIASDLKFPEFILYKPQSGGCVEGTVLTTIGFLKEAPQVNLHGFNVYHKNRLILPFWHVVSYSDSRGRGVVDFWLGVLEANFIEPTHNKQDFEKTSVFQKLENRLKEMTWEYWDYHCGLIGYQVKKKLPKPTPSLGSADMKQPVVRNKISSIIATTNAAPPGFGLRHLPAASSNGIEGSPGKLLPNVQRICLPGEQLKRKGDHRLAEPEKVKRRAGGVNVIDTGSNLEIQLTLWYEEHYGSSVPLIEKSVPTAVNQLEDEEAINLMQENQRLQVRCLEFEKEEKELNRKAILLRSELKDLEHEYTRMLAELQLLDEVKEENNVC